MKLYIFDFDGTLANTPSPEFGKPEYKKITGTDWPYQGWWGRVESMSYFNIDLIEEQYKIAKEALENNDYVYILTSRLPKFKEHIINICKKNNLDIPENNILTKTIKEKGERIYDICTLIHSDIDELFFYDDRQKEIDSLNEWKNKIEDFGIKVNIIKVQSDAID